MKKQLSALLALSMVTGTLTFNAGASDVNDVAQEEEKLVSVMYDMTNVYNTDMVFTSIGPTPAGASYRNGNAAYAGFFAWKPFTELEYWEEGSSWVDNYTNVMNFEGTRFTFYVPDSQVNSDGQFCTWRNRTGTEPFKKFDVKDGKYESIEIMSNTERSGKGDQRVYVELNYADGSEVKSYQTFTVGSAAPAGVPNFRSFAAANDDDFIGTNGFDEYLGNNKSGLPKGI